MTSRRLPQLTPLVVLAAVAVAAAAPPSADDAAHWWSDVEALANDGMQGRMTGSAEHRRAAEYIARGFEQAGLAPAGTNGWFQAVPFVSQRLVPDESSLTLVTGTTEVPLPIGDEAIVGLRYDPAPSVDAQLVFAGYGLTIPAAALDDLAGLDARGKVVVYVPGAPEGLPTDLLAAAQSAGERWAAFSRAGAIGAIAISVQGASDVPWQRSARLALRPTLRLADASLDDTRGQQIGLTVNQAGAAKLLAGSGHDIASLAAIAQTHGTLPRFALQPRLRAHLAVTRTTLGSDNVVGLLRGREPGEHVVLSAHLDHVGVGEPIDGDGIYNGAMDNASGIATLLEAARQLAQSPSPPRRSILFLAVTAEEQGLLGSRYWAAHSTVPRTSIVADVNVDMFLPLFPMKSIIGLGAEESDLGDDLRAAADRAGVRVIPDPEPRRRRFIRSDQYSFIRAGIPALALKVGYEVGTPEHEIVKQWTEHRYHAPSDDLAQPVDRAAAAAFNRLYIDLAATIANRPTRPAWKPESPFRRFARM